jgi:hypothetical protein
MESMNSPKREKFMMAVNESVRSGDKNNDLENLKRMTQDAQAHLVELSSSF